MSLWKKYLKHDGYIAVSEISWLTDTRPDEIEQYWLNAYSEIDIIQNKLSVIEKCGYTSVAYFALDDKCWTDNYYQPLLENSEAFLKKYDYSDEVKEFLEAGKIEADMYNRFKDYYSYVFYIAKKNRSSMPTTDEELQKNTVGERHANLYRSWDWFFSFSNFLLCAHAFVCGALQ